MNGQYVLYSLAAFLITYFTVPFVKKIAFKIGALDLANNRRVHKDPTPNIGGVAIFAGFAVVSIVSLELSREVLGILLGGALMLVVGFMDSISDLKALPKLIMQVTAALILISFGVKIDFLSHPGSGIFVLGSLSIPFTILWVVGVTNAINLIDGLDGLAAGVVTISAAVLATISFLTGRLEILPLALYLGASSAAFLKYNFFPASIFMGDSGSQFLGFTLAGLAMLGTLKSATFLSLLIPALIMGVPVFDTLSAIIRRLRNGKPVMAADRGHLHHFFLDQGFNQKSAVLLMYGLNLLLGIIAIVSTQVSVATSLILFILAVIFMILVRSGRFNNVSYKGVKE